MIYFEILILSIIAGIFGRMSGSGMNKLWRRLGVPAVTLIAFGLLCGAQMHFWWAYLLILGFHYVALMGYWDWLFGYDNMWFSGFATGLCFMVAIVLGVAWWLILIRAVVLAVVWGCLNVYLPQKGIWIWRRDIVEENVRYASIPLTVIML